MGSNSTSEMLRLTCACGQVMKVPADAMGAARKCVRCGTAITVGLQNTQPLDTGPAHEPPAPAARSAPRKRLIGELLVEEGIITQAHLDEALKVQEGKGGKVVENLIALEYLDTRTFLRFLSKQPGVASIDLLHYTIPKDVLDLIPPEYALRHEILPIDRMGKDLTVGMACPLDSRTIQELQGMTGLRVRPLLVSMNDIRVALDRYFGSDGGHTLDVASLPNMTPPLPERVLSQVESALTFEGVAHLVREVKALPALPETVNDVRAAMEKPETGAKDIAAILERDPSLAAKLIGLANSAAYGFAHRVVTVDHAVGLLGLREVYSIVLASVVVDYFERSKYFDYRAFWKRSMFCAAATRVVIRVAGRKHLGVAFGAGLMHDIGRLVLAEIAPGRYREVDQTQSDAAVIAKELELFGISHPEVGHLLAESWDLPTELIEPMRWHADLDSAEDFHDLVAAVALAELMADAYGKITRENVGALVRACKAPMQLLHMSDQQLIQALGETAQAVQTLP